jgi:AraC-like DNA-binding protein
VQFLALPIIMSLPSATVEIEYIMFLISAFIIFMTGFFTIRQPEIISGIYKNGNNVKYEKSGLDKAGSKAYLAELLELMSKRKLYLDEDIKMTGVADELKISPTYLSQIINAELGCNFFDFINKYRVKEVKSRLEDPNYSHFTLLGIAFDCGFSNKTSFNRAFKRFTGITPSEYHKSILIKKSVV